MKSERKIEAEKDVLASNSYIFFFFKTKTVNIKDINQETAVK